MSSWTHRSLRGGVGAASVIVVAALALAGCGSGHRSATADASSPQSVTVVKTNVTAEILPASSTASARRDEAVFTLSATDRAGRPAGDQPVSFWIGPMFPRCGTPIKRWYPVSGGGARRYVAFASLRTNAAGQATLRLYGQRARTMEMVTARVGDLNGFDGGRALALLDAWWTAPGVQPSAPIGDQVTVTPFLSSQSAARFGVHVSSQRASAVPSAQVLFTASTSSGMSQMSGHSRPTVERRTDAAGDTSFVYPRGVAGTLRIKVDEPGSPALFSGAMNSEAITLH